MSNTKDKQKMSDYEQTRKLSFVAAVSRIATQINSVHEHNLKAVALREQRAVTPELKLKVGD